MVRRVGALRADAFVAWICPAAQGALLFIH
jgi:hypothetical protein